MERVDPRLRGYGQYVDGQALRLHRKTGRTRARLQ